MAGDFERLIFPEGKMEKNYIEKYFQEIENAEKQADKDDFAEGLR